MKSTELIEILKDITRTIHLNEADHGSRYVPGGTLSGRTSKLHNRYKKYKMRQLAEAVKKIKKLKKIPAGKTATGQRANQIIVEPTLNDPTRVPHPMGSKPTNK